MTAPAGLCLLAPVGRVRPEGSLGWGEAADWRAAVELDVHPYRVDVSAPEVVLTRRQQRIVAFIAAHIDEYGYPPSYREIGSAVGLKSPNSVRYQVGELRRLGFLAEPAGGCQARALRLIKGGVG